MEIQYLEINQSNEPNENISDYIKDFSEAATVIDVQCNAIPVHFEYGIKVVAFIKYEDNKEATPEKKQWLKEFFDKHLDKKTKLFIDEPFDNRVTKGDEVYVDTLRNCLFQQASMAYTDKQIVSIYKEWLQNH
ncbi:hypothetical protein CHPC873_0040 [Streptococcus phage CHPC873]|uniref:Uncharacterized protein n=1 Tax=Streptococcus phage CHPC873 TaxID=2365042 RepID=A0A3G8F791_9CAUD|nr:hypothetical protein PP211_gp40 [Streptococcus phage CHPC873]AZF90643.1 hypothetical protein CHPC873_0040 [Streptococcus phage CHPC873]